MEKIQQVEGKTTVQTVVVKEEDLVVDAIAKNSGTVFAITKDGQDAEFNNAEISTGRGLLVGEGIIAADAALVFDKDGNYDVKNSNGKWSAELLGTDKSGVAFIKIKPKEGDAKLPASLPSFVDLNSKKAGQKVIIYGNSISSYIYEGDSSLNLGVSKANSGAAVLDLDGNVLGMVLSGEAQNFVGAKTITEALPQFAN